MSSLVAKNNTIHVSSENLGGEKGKKVIVSWSQSLKTRSAEYWLCEYSVKSGGDAVGVIYVEANKLDEFKAKKTSGDDFTLVVDDSFQYGQNKEQTKRFLVFHDKEHKPYQHRYVENTLTVYGGKAADLLEKMGYKDIGNVGNVAKNFVGDYLKNF